MSPWGRGHLSFRLIQHEQQEDESVSDIFLETHKWTQMKQKHKPTNKHKYTKPTQTKSEHQPTA